MSLYKTLLKADMFGSATSFSNFDGDDRFRSIPGALLSIMMRMLGLYFTMATFLQMINNEEVEIKNYTLTDSAQEMMAQDINMADYGVELVIGFNIGTAPFFVPSEDLLRVEASLLRTKNYVDIKYTSIELDKCGDGLYDFDTLDDPFIKVTMSNGLCIKNKSLLNLQGLSDSPDS